MSLIENGYCDICSMEASSFRLSDKVWPKILAFILT